MFHEWKNKRSIGTYLCLNVQDAPFSLLFNLTDGLETGAIIIARKLGVFDEGAIADEILEYVLRDEEVVLSVEFAGTRRASGVYGKVR